MIKYKFMVYLLIFVIFLFGGMYFTDIRQNQCIFEEYIGKSPYEEEASEVSGISQTGLININLYFICIF